MPYKKPMDTVIGACISRAATRNAWRDASPGNVMKKHQFVKEDCNCSRKATYFRCKFCHSLEYKSPQEIRTLNSTQATCTSPEALAVPPHEAFKGLLGGTFDCLAPDFETYYRDNPAAANAK